MATRQNWIVVASAEHARLGRDERRAGPPPASAAPSGCSAARVAANVGFQRERRAGPPPASAAPSGGSAARVSANVGANSVGGFMQVGHGKLAPLKRINAGDRVAYYSPTAVYGVKDDLQSFVSIGVVQVGEPYAFDMGNGFVPYRRDVVYLSAQEAAIAPLLDDFEFIENRQRWGYKFRFGLFDVSDHDMRLIAQAMGADLAQLGL